MKFVRPSIKFGSGALGQIFSITTLPPISVNWHASQSGATYAASLIVYLRVLPLALSRHPHLYTTHLQSRVRVGVEECSSKSAVQVMR